jgi:hypothetical protein
MAIVKIQQSPGGQFSVNIPGALATALNDKTGEPMMWKMKPDASTWSEQDDPDHPRYDGECEKCGAKLKQVYGVADHPRSRPRHSVRERDADESDGDPRRFGKDGLDFATFIKRLQDDGRFARHQEMLEHRQRR